MAEKVRIWFDAEADFLEVLFSEEPGYEKQTAHDAVMERVNSDGKLLGFSILGVTKFTRDKPLSAELPAA